MITNERSLPRHGFQGLASVQIKGFADLVTVPSAALSRDQKLRRLVLLSFRDPFPAQCMELSHVSDRKWRSLIHWLDVSGLALYFLDRLVNLQLTHILPEQVLARLRRNLQDNTERTRGMIAESMAIQEEFQADGVPYAVLKGFSLSPESVPRMEMRHQFDLDFLIAEDAVLTAQQVLQRQGYRLYAVSNKSWEFKKEEKIGISMEDFYKDNSGRTVELHLEARIAGAKSELDRAIERDFYGIDMPVLSPVDLFLGQGMHAYKHICGEFSRTAHLLEFYRHILMRAKDNVFWHELRLRGEGSPKVSLGIGMVTQLITHVMGAFAPKELTEWTVDKLPPAALLWIKLHGPRTVFGDVPGSKLYLLLERELECFGNTTSRTRLGVLLPRRLPPMVLLASRDENLWIRARRYRMHMRYVLLRLHFHVIEGLRYGWEARRWKQHVEGITR